MGWELQVRHNLSTLTYEVERLEEEDYTIDESADTDSISYSDIEVLFDGDFLGATDIDDLPVDDGGDVPRKDWRARLLYNGVEYLNGVIRRWDGVTWEPDHERWIIRIESFAEEDFLDRLESIILATEGATEDDGHVIDPELEAELPAGTKIYGKGNTVKGSPVYQYCYKIHGVWDAVKEILITKQRGGGSVTINQPRPLFEYSFTYDDGGVEKTITRTPTIALDAFAFPLRPRVDKPANYMIGPFDREASLPLWTGRDLFESLQVFHGWSIRAEYEPFPQRNLSVELVENKWVTPTDPPVLDGKVEEENLESYRIEEPEFSDFGVRYSWTEGYTNRKQYNWQGKEFRADAEDPYHSEPYSRTAPMFLYQAGNKKYGRDGNPDNEHLTTLPFHVPYIWYLKISDPIVPDAANHPNYSERIWWAKGYTVPEQAEGEPHLFELVQGMEDENPSEYHIFQGRVPQASGPDQFKLRMATDPLYVIENHEIATSELIILEARFDVEDASPAYFKVGDPKYGVRFLADDYMVRKRVESPSFKGVDFSLARIASSLTPSPILVYHEEGNLSPLELGATCSCVDDQFSFDLSWVEPTGSLVPDYYEIEYRPYYKEAWESLDTVAAGSTSHSFAVDAFGEERGVFFFRIRAVYPKDPSGFSPWVSALAECPTCGTTEGEDPVVNEGNCFELLYGSATIPAGETSVTVAPSPSLSQAISNGSAADDPQLINILATPQGDISPATKVWTGNRTDISFDIIVDAALGSDVRFSWNVSRIRTEIEECYPCWRRNTWHDFPSGNNSNCTDFESNPFQHHMWDALDPQFGATDSEIYLIQQWFGSYAAGNHGGGPSSEIELIKYDPPRWNPDTLETEGNTYDTSLSNLTGLSSPSEYSTASSPDALWVAIAQSDGSGGIETGLYRYTISTDTWTEMTPNPSARSGAALVYFDGDLHLIGGSSIEGPSAGDPETHFIYDIDTDSWSNGPRIFAGTYDYVTRASGIEYLNRVYLIGGVKNTPDTGAGSSDQLEILVYDGTSWSGTGFSLSERADYPRVSKKFINNAAIYVVGGYGDDSGTGTPNTLRNRHYRFIPFNSINELPIGYKDPSGVETGIEGFGWIGYLSTTKSPLTYIFLALGGLDNIPTSSKDGSFNAGCYNTLDGAYNPFDGKLSV